MPHADPEKRRAYERDYNRARDPEKRRAHCRTDRAKHLEKRRATERAYTAKRKGSEKYATYHAEYRAKHRERLREQNRQYLASMTAEQRAERARRRRAWALQNDYGISVREYERMDEAQKGCCAICGKPPKGKRRNQHAAWQSALVVDHCHVTGRVRGLLCTPCNVLLGALDNAEWLAAAISYLRAY